VETIDITNTRKTKYWKNKKKERLLNRNAN